MRLPDDFCILVPCNPELLPLHTKNRDVVVQIPLPDGIGPFYLIVTLIGSGSPQAPVQGPLITRPISFVFQGLPYGIALTARPVKETAGRAKPDWAPFPFFLLRTAA
jgi:hypothetical protein